ncbi:MAG: hypothetical protein HC908_15820 [Calothrix sp. SM1_7_51]|nr:hypothetical protein [Calothrix sp. SM1_7_51]
MKTKVLTEPPEASDKSIGLPFGIIIPSILVVCAGSLGLWAMQMRTNNLATSQGNPTVDTPKRTRPTPIVPTNLTPPTLWALLTTNQDIIFNKTSQSGKVTEVIAPKGSVLQITKVEMSGNFIEMDYPINVRLCPTSVKPEPTPVKLDVDRRLLLPKEEVSIQYSKIFPGIASMQPSEKNQCLPKSGSSTPPVETNPDTGVGSGGVGSGK